MWFKEIAEVDNPGTQELQGFVDGVLEFLEFVLERRADFAFLWNDNTQLREMALDTFERDVIGSGRHLREVIPNIETRRLMLHGLEGRPLRFKIAVTNSIANTWDFARKQFRIRDWFKRIIEAIDALLDSLIHAAGGVGGLVKEFKDALSALAPSSE
jgi:hypothetical protein